MWVFHPFEKHHHLASIRAQASLFPSSLMSTKHPSSVHSETQQVIHQFWSLRPTFVVFFFLLSAPWYFLPLKDNKEIPWLILLPFPKISLPWKPGTKWKTSAVVIICCFLPARRKNLFPLSARKGQNSWWAKAFYTTSKLSLAFTKLSKAYPSSLLPLTDVQE